MTIEIAATEIATTTTLDFSEILPAERYEVWRESISEIAFSLGFNSESDFSRSFQRFFQFTPSEVRYNAFIPSEDNLTINSQKERDFHFDDWVRKL